MESKSVGRNDFTKIPSGLNGIEDRLAIVWEKLVHNEKADTARSRCYFFSSRSLKPRIRVTR
jgi:hypothetical protein